MTGSVRDDESFEDLAGTATVQAAPDASWLVLGWEVVLATVLSAIGVFALVTVAGGAVGSGYGGGAAIGAFCALWGGPGFGVMVACAMHAARTERPAPLEDAGLDSGHAG